MIRHLVNGICMALADSVPGVSGGTIAFILGFYDQFITSINDMVYEKGEKRKQAILYLLKLGTGWLVGMIGAVLVLSSVFETQIYFVSSLFLGFIIASIPFIYKEEKAAFIENRRNIIFSVIAAFLVVGIVIVNQNYQISSVNIQLVSFSMLLYVFLVGMIAVSAMFLPGISGSTLLLIFGLYIQIIKGIKEVLYFNFSYLPALLVFGLGIITGALTIVKLIKISLEKQRSKVMYSIMGLMIGSLYAIIMGPTTLNQSMDHLTVSNFKGIAFVIGIVAVAILQLVGKKRSREIVQKKTID